jgi:Clostripain family.
MSVDSSTGELSIEREKVNDSGAKGDVGVWTIFVYLCGTDLESDSGAGTSDLEEMLSSTHSDNVRFIVETGGTKEWEIGGVDDDKIQRFLVQNGKKKVIDEKSLASMGTTDTLSDFLVWGTKEYPSEHMGFVMWNHGGGRIAGSLL